MSSFERFAVQRVIDKASQAGLEIPQEVHGMLHLAGCDGTYPARWWADNHPTDDWTPCCYGSIDGQDRCTCWRPVFDVVQASPLRGQPEVRDRMCGDCAFRPGSPERATPFMEETLYDSARSGDPFWCHDGMRRPARWEHPDGRVVGGSPDDWQPATVDSVPYRADGRPALLCAGWAAVAAKAERDMQDALQAERGAGS